MFVITKLTDESCHYMLIHIYIYTQFIHIYIYYYFLYDLYIVISIPVLSIFIYTTTNHNERLSWRSSSLRSSGVDINCFVNARVGNGSARWRRKSLRWSLCEGRYEHVDEGVYECCCECLYEGLCWRIT